VAEAANDPTSGDGPTTGNDPTREEPPQDSSEGSEPMGNIAKTRRQKETKDLAWSHNTEQALRQFFAAHKSAASFDFTLVDCRTTFCEVEAVGPNEDAWPTWGQITYDVSKQPWSEFGTNGSSYESRNGRTVFVMTLFRSSHERHPTN
jgi:hypothetical protein